MPDEIETLIAIYHCHLIVSNVPFFLHNSLNYTVFGVFRKKEQQLFADRYCNLNNNVVQLTDILELSARVDVLCHTKLLLQ